MFNLFSESFLVYLNNLLPAVSSATFLKLEILQDTFVMDFLAWYLFLFTHPTHSELVLVYSNELHLLSPPTRKFTEQTVPPTRRPHCSMFRSELRSDPSPTSDFVSSVVRWKTKLEWYTLLTTYVVFKIVMKVRHGSTRRVHVITSRTPPRLAYDDVDNERGSSRVKAD